MRKINLLVVFFIIVVTLTSCSNKMEDMSNGKENAQTEKTKTEVIENTVLSGYTDVGDIKAKPSKEDKSDTKRGVQTDNTIDKVIDSTVSTAFTDVGDMEVEPINMDMSNMKEIAQTVKINKEVPKSTVLNVYTAVGNIEVKPSEDKFIKIKASKKVMGGDETKMKELINNIEINLSADGGKLLLKAYPKNNKQQDLLKWKEKNYGKMNLNINFVIEAPKNIKIYTLNSNVGKISMKDLSGSFEAKTGVGSIEFNKISFTRKSIIETETGSVKIDIAKLNSADDISIKTGVGDVKLKVPSDLKCTIETETFMKEKKKESMNGGGTLIKVKAGVGKVSINK